jgi:hypothetical protein
VKAEPKEVTGQSGFWGGKALVESLTEKSLPAEGARVEREQDPFLFRNWRSVLVETATSPRQRSDFERDIIAFLGFCKKSRAPASIILSKAYLARQTEQDFNAIVFLMPEALRRDLGRIDFCRDAPSQRIPTVLT